METLGYRIKEMREMVGLTQPQLAKAIGVANSTVSVWENDLNEPKAGYVTKLCKLFDVSADYLLGLENDTTYKEALLTKYAYIKDENRLLELFRQADPDRKKMILRITEAVTASQ